MDQFQRLRDILIGNHEADISQFSDEIIRRFIIKYNNFIKHSSSVGPQDIVISLREILLREEARQGDIVQRLRVPSHDPWPTPEHYKRSGISIFSSDDQSFVVQTSTWKPSWASTLDFHFLEKSILLGEQRQVFDPIMGDPFLNELNLTHYRSPGQREAIRAILTAPPGATIVVNLPTGAGKSLCAHLPAILESKSLGVTVVIVPTVALCIDQERALQPFINHPTAYFGGDEPGVKERKEGIRRRIRDGSQRILFTSPESFQSSLSESLYIAAQQGFFRMLVIDEAHMVDQWGDDFRPAFQELSGLRKSLLSCSSDKPFLTLLLSATITENSLNTLNILFGQPGPFAMISAVQLRSEPSYWIVPCITEDIQRVRITEAINHLPRPLILYTSKKETARSWEIALRQNGYQRIGLFHGDTDSITREEIINQWRNDDLDIVVATSAFGMGIDYSNVKVILHACVPENIDRYYQEVGRGGRNGKASLALMMYTPKDITTAQHINERIIISSERGLERWTSMFNHKEVLSDGRYKVPIDVPPSFEPGDIDMVNSYNTSWNIKTLILMARSGLIELDAQPSFLRSALEEKNISENENEEKNDNNFRIIRILEERHLQSRIWEERVQNNRIQTNRITKKGNQLMGEVLEQAEQPTKCLADIFESVYSFDTSGRNVINGRVHVSRSCGGCPYCRATSISPYTGILPSPRPIWTKVDYGSDQLRILLGDKMILGVFYRTRDIDRLHPESKQIEKLIIWLAVQGVRNIVAPPLKLQAWETILRNIPNCYCFYFYKYAPLFMPLLPTLIFLDQNQELNTGFYSNDAMTVAFPRIMLLPDNIGDPERPGIPLIKNFPANKLLLQELCMEVGL